MCLTESLSQYRKTLMRKPKESDTVNESRKKRARKQRVGSFINKFYNCNDKPLQKYERRGRLVGETEREMWKHVTASMMSDEEDIGGNTFKVHVPKWRSDELNVLLCELDSRADAKAAYRSHPRRSRIQGTPHKVPAPSVSQDWMIRKETDSDVPSSPPLL